MTKRTSIPVPIQPDKEILQRELELITVSHEIGSISESNSQYPLSLAIHIDKPIHSLTVDQLLSFHRECVQRFNQWEE